MRISIFYETWNGHAGLVADRIARGLGQAGHEATVKRCRDATEEDLSTAEAVLVGASVRAGRHHSKAVSFVRSNLGILEARPSAFFSVSLTARRRNERESEELEKLLAGFEKDSGWEPARRACFAGALAYTKYWFPLRWLMKSIAKSQGSDVDTSRDHVYTDWDAVDGFASEFCERLQKETAAR